jgi:hypothetical protein
MATPANKRKDYIDSQIKAGSAKTRKELGIEYDDLQLRKTTDVANVDDLKAKVLRFLPAYAYLLDKNGPFGADVAQVLANAVKGDYQTPRLEGELQNTGYFKTAESSVRAFDAKKPQDQEVVINKAKSLIRTKYGNLNLDDQAITDISRTIARNGLDDVAAGQLIYSTSFSREPRNLVAPSMAMSSPDASRLKTLAKNYNYSITDDEIKNVLTGKAGPGQNPLTEADLLNKMKLQIKGAMPYLSDQIDAGLSLEDIGATYKKYAGSILEKDPNSINMFDGPYLAAFGSKDSGQMSLGDWVAKLKTDPKFGYQNTRQANQDATSIGLSIAKAFGKVK